MKDLTVAIQDHETFILHNEVNEKFRQWKGQKNDREKFRCCVSRILSLFIIVNKYLSHKVVESSGLNMMLMIMTLEE